MKRFPKTLREAYIKEGESSFLEYKLEYIPVFTLLEFTKEREVETIMEKPYREKSGILKRGLWVNW